jgi:hypothetical protein
MADLAAQRTPSSSTSKMSTENKEKSEPVLFAVKASGLVGVRQFKMLHLGGMVLCA